MPNPKTVRVIPNTERVLVRLLTQKSLLPKSEILISGQLKAGEQLLYGEIVEGGQTRFKAGTRVYYSEYSASALYQLGKVERGELTQGNAFMEENTLYVVAEDDVMCYEDVI